MTRSARVGENAENSPMFELTMFCEESLGKIKFRAFGKRVGPQILSLESFGYFGASEHYWVVEKK